MTYVPQIGERVLYAHCNGLLLSEVKEVNKRKNMVQIVVLGDNHNRAWLGLHWVDLSDIHEKPKEM